jgi:hypothetical protein
MADSFITLPVDAVPAGKKVDTTQLIVNGETVERERDQIGGGADTELAEVKTEALAAHHGLVVRPIDIVSPIRDALLSSALAQSASVDLDGTTIAAAKTGKLVAVDVASTQGCKWDIKSRDGAVLLTFATVTTSGIQLTHRWESPNKRFTTLLGNGVDENFRVTVTNLGVAAADVYATIYWDETD